LQIYTSKAFPNNCRNTSRLLGHIYSEKQDWNSAATAYDTALVAAEILYQNCLFLGGQAAEILETGDLHHRTTYAHAKNGNLQKALHTLELGRARGLSDSLARDRANLDQLQTIRPDLVDRYQTLTQEIRNLEIQQRNPDTNHPDQLRQALTQTRQSLTETIATIQQVEGYQAFLKPPTAAWTTDDTMPTGKRYALDTIHFTYAPNARSLREARELGDRTPADSILAIENPTQDLANATREIESALHYFGDRSTHLRYNQATHAAVLNALPQHTLLHCACHGIANLTAPLDSGLVMFDRLLTLRDIFALKLNQQNSGGIRLAILSACETGLSGTETIDEVISLPTGLLQAGVAGIAASLWSVADLSTMMLLTRFYDLWRKDDQEPTLALRQAQQWVRDTTSQQKAKYFEKTNPDLFSFLILCKPDYFSHPFHWAAFTYTGV
jgi:CHAT domain-containing protein